MRPQVKICGITSLDDALMCLGEGGDSIGINFYRQSPRYVEPPRAAEIIRHLPPFSIAIGVFVNAARDEVQRIIEQTGLQMIQLSGDETPEDCLGYPVPVIKVFRSRHGEVLSIPPYPIRAALVDGAADGLYGGTGQLADLELAGQLKKYYPLILSGGISPENVLQAIERVKPDAIDINSKVESAPGKKDPAMVRRLFTQLESLNN